MKKIIFVIIALFIIIAVYSDESVINYKTSDNTSDVVTSASPKTNLEKSLVVLNYVHSSLSTTAYVCMLGEIGVGSALLYMSYNNPDYYTNTTKEKLQLAHKILMSISYPAAGTGMIISFITFGIKVYKKMPVNLPHFIMALVTTGFYILEIISMIVTKYYYDVKSPYAQAIGLSHGISCSILAVCFTVSLITIPIFMNKKKVINK